VSMSRLAFGGVAVGTLLALSLVGCAAADPDGAGSSSTGSNDTATPDASESTTRLALPEQTVGADADCSFTTGDALSAIWGVPFVDTDANLVIEGGGDGGILWECGWNETDSGLGLSIVLQFREHRSEDTAVADIAEARSVAELAPDDGAVADEIAGVGDEGVFTTAQDGVVVNEQASVRYGSTVVLVSAVNLGGVGPDTRDRIVETLTALF